MTREERDELRRLHREVTAFVQRLEELGQDSLAVGARDLAERMARVYFEVDTEEPHERREVRCW